MLELLPEFNADFVFYSSLVIGFALVAEAAYLVFYDTNAHRKSINRRLSVLDNQVDREQVLVQIRRERGLTAEGGWTIAFTWLNRLILQSGVTIGPHRIGMFAAALGVIVAGGIFLKTGNILYAIGGLAFGGIIAPFLFLRNRRKARHAKFAEQLPETLDIITRSLRAGHPVPIALQMVSREMADPIGTEFGIIADEITYGLDLETAMRNLQERVGQDDLPLFVTSVSVQMSTGGNLAQVLENLSKVIRDRFKMRRKIRALSSEGRVSAYILTSTPFIVFGAVNWMSPPFYGDVWHHPWFMYGLGGCLFWMMVGNAVVVKMIRFKF